MKFPHLVMTTWFVTSIRGNYSLSEICNEATLGVGDHLKIQYSDLCQWISYQQYCALRGRQH